MIDPILVAAGVSLIVGLSGTTVALIIGWRQGAASKAAAEAAKISAEAAKLTATAAGDRAIAAMRLSWLENLRKLLAEYHSILQTYKEDEDHRKISEIGTQLDLMLNLQEDDQKKLWEIADKLFRMSDQEERVAMDLELMEAGRAVLKAEWNKIKWELRGNPVQQQTVSRL